MADHDPHDAEQLEAFASAGLDALEEARPDPAHGAIAIGVAPCGCFALAFGGLDRRQVIDVLINALRESIEATGGTFSIGLTVAERERWQPGLGSSSTGPAS